MKTTNKKKRRIRQLPWILGNLSIWESASFVMIMFCLPHLAISVDSVISKIRSLSSPAMISTFTIQTKSAFKNNNLKHKNIPETYSKKTVGKYTRVFLILKIWFSLLKAMKLNHGVDHMIPLLNTLYLELNQIFYHHATTYQEALVQALLDQDMTTVTTATMAKTIHFAHKSQVVLLMHSLFPLPLLSANPFIASSACKVKYTPGNQQCRTILQLKTSCAGVLHCRSLPT